MNLQAPVAEEVDIVEALFEAPATLKQRVEKARFTRPGVAYQSAGSWYGRLET